MATKKAIHVTTEQTYECVEPGSGDGRVWRTVHLRPEGRSWWDSARPLRVRHIEIATGALPAIGRRRVLKVGMAVDMARGERSDNVYFNLEELLPRMARDPDTRRIMAKAIAAALEDEASDIVRRAKSS